MRNCACTCACSVSKVTPFALSHLHPADRYNLLRRSIASIERTGKSFGGRPRAVRVRFYEYRDKMAVFSQAIRLANSPYSAISLDNDLTAAQRTARKEQQGARDAATARGDKTVWNRLNPTELIIFKGGLAVSPPAGESPSAAM